MKAGACLAMAIVAATLGLAGCSSSPPKTAASFCQVYEQQKHQYLAKYGTPDSGGLAALGQLIGAVSDWVPMFEALDAAAPPAIEPDVSTILDSFKQQEQNAGQAVSNPLAGFASSLMSGLMATSSWNNLSTYIAQNCGPEGG